MPLHSLKKNSTLTIKFPSRSKDTTLSALSIEPVVLEGRYVRLEPLSMDHHAALTEVGIDEDIWRWVTSQVRNADDMRKYIEIALKAQQDGTALPFTTIEKSSGQVVGSTRYGNI